MIVLLLVLCCFGCGFVGGCAWSRWQLRRELADISPALRRSR